MTEGQPLEELTRQFEAEKAQIRTEEDLVRLKAAYLGKQGHLTAILKTLGTLPPEERPKVGSQVNQLKAQIEQTCRLLQEEIQVQKQAAKLTAETLDVTQPGRVMPQGGIHPITQLLEETEDIFREIGFDVFEGPEIETDFYNFEALNIPANHPARDMQDTFYLSAPSPLTSHLSPALLRTHTSPVQIHVMKRKKPPIRMIAPGVVYRRDSDVSHSPMFHQVEGLAVDKDIRFSDLKGVLSYFLERLFGERRPLRFRPSYFPFTEPSAEVDMQCVVCRGKKTVAGESCRLCKATGWIEMGGCGMVHPAVFEKVGYDPKKVQGFAFGMGMERLAMIKFGIPDIRLFFENDLRFLKQF